MLVFAVGALLFMVDAGCPIASITDLEVCLCVGLRIEVLTGCEMISEIQMRGIKRRIRGRGLVRNVCARLAK